MKNNLFFSLFIVILSILPSCGNLSGSKLGQYDWLEGTWKSKDDDWGIVIIEKNRYKCACWAWDNSPDDIKSAKWIPIDIQERVIDVWENSYLTLSGEAPNIVISPEKKELEFVTGEYSSTKLYKEGGLPTKKEETRKTKSGSSGSGVLKDVKSAINNDGIVLFETDYAYAGNRRYWALFPFPYSEDGDTGKIYDFSYDTDSNYLTLVHSGDYEIHLNYLRIFNLKGHLGRYSDDSSPNDRIYTLDSDQSKLCLQGRFISTDEQTTIRQTHNTTVMSGAKEILSRSRLNQHAVQ